MTTSPTATLLEHFANLEDPRVERTKEHLLIDIIGITICGVICGADSWVDIEPAIPNSNFDRRINRGEDKGS